MIRLPVLLVACQLLVTSSFAQQGCYDANGTAKYCAPPAESSGGRDNLVADRPPTATSTCGEAEGDRVCARAGARGEYEARCKPCDSSEFSTDLITDDEGENVTYWQSQTYSVLQYPDPVNLTFSLGKTYAVEAIEMVFQSSRPESFVLLASADYGATFWPIHYFSRSCYETYGVMEVAAGGSDWPACSSEEAQLLPLTGGIVSFSASTWTGGSVLATDIQIRLDRHNTFGDECTLEEAVLDSYYYAISDVVIRGTCFCNGHASSCSEDDSGELRCDCEHNTAGRDCEVCLPLFNDLPWRQATQQEPAECKECNCYGRASKCSFDAQVYADSGSVSGGVCDCLPDTNTSGKNCEVCTAGEEPPCAACGCNGEEAENFMCDQVSGNCVCRPGFSGSSCLPCNCVASMTVNNGECDSDGRCQCIDGVGGISCDHCLSNYYMHQGQCIPCDCDLHGSQSDTCNGTTGQCMCKNGVISRDCSVCAHGFHRVEDGCPACPECYDDVLLEYQSTKSLLEELIQAINASLNGSMEDDRLFSIIGDLSQRLEVLVTSVSDLYVREMNLTAKIQNETSAAAANRADIDMFHVQLMEYENLSSMAAKQLINSSTVAAHVDIVVREIDIKLSQYALGNLTTAQQLFLQIEDQLAILNDTATRSEHASLEQKEQVDQLLQGAMEALNGSIQAHSEICAALEKENETLFYLNSLVKNNVTDLDQLHSETQMELSKAATRTDESLNESVRLKSEVTNLSIPNYDPNALIMESEENNSTSSEIIDDSMSLLSDIEIYHQNFTELNRTAHELLTQAMILNDIAMNLTVRAHAARALGNQSVVDAEYVINQTNHLLSELKKRLTEFEQFSLDLETLKNLVEQAENVSLEARSTAMSQRELLLKADQTANSAIEILLNAAISTQFAVENATVALTKANDSFTNAQTLKANIEKLSVDTVNANQSVIELEERANQDLKAVTDAKGKANDATLNANTALDHVNYVKLLLGDISKELNSLKLIPEKKFSDFMMQLNSINETLAMTDGVLQDTQQDLDDLEAQFDTLQERYTTLLQHRDLLRDIYESINKLDCTASNP